MYNNNTIHNNNTIKYIISLSIHNAHYTHSILTVRFVVGEFITWEISANIFTDRKLDLSPELRHLLPDLAHPHEDLLPQQVAVHAHHAQSH